MNAMRRLSITVFAIILVWATHVSAAETKNWIAAWTASVHGPYPIGNPTAQPELKFVFASPEQGAVDLTFRQIVKPDIWGREARIRLSNAFGTRPVTFDGAYIGLQNSGAAILPGTNTKVLFGGKTSVTIAPGEMAVSDPVALSFVRDPADKLLTGRMLAISFHVAGETGPMTWHAKALRTSYLTAPRAGSLGADTNEQAFQFSTTSWYFLDMVAMTAAPGARAIVTFGDSITDGTASTMNGDDRWPDVFSRRLHAAVGDRFSVVNEGIGGNQVIGPAEYGPASPVPGGPAAISRLDRDIVSLPGAGAVIWLEGINDFGTGKASVEAVMEGYRKGVAHLRAKIPGVKVYVATLTSALNAANATHGSAEVDQKRRALNAFFRTSKLFDGVADFDAATFDAATGEIKPTHQPNSAIGGPGDKLHPNRAGYAAMGSAIDLRWFGAGKP